MKHTQKKKKKNHVSPLVWILAVGLLMVALLLGSMIVFFATNGGAAGVRQVQTDPVQTTQTPPVTDLIMEATDTDMVVDTPFGKLYYPVEYMEHMRVEQETAGRNVIIRYFAKIDGVEEYEIFSVWFGEKKEILCGSVPDEKGAVTVVSIDMNLEIPGDDWSDNMRLLTYSLQEGVNYLMEKMDELNAFVRAD